MAHGRHFALALFVLALYLFGSLAIAVFAVRREQIVS